MSWTAYRVVLRLAGPMHIGNAKIGNLQRTRPYVTGRVLWGALTMRLTRRLSAPTSNDYVETGLKVHDHLATTYFYPTPDASGGSQPLWPWEPEPDFSSHHLAAYGGTALQARNQAAAENTLHEIEQILAVTRDGQPVYLCGYLFENEAIDRERLDWRAVLNQLQLGGERSYGWGGVRQAQAEKLAAGPVNLFARTDVTLTLSGERPVISLAAGAPLLAHTAVEDDLPVRGRVEPLVGRVWDNGDGRRPDYTGLCYLPGSEVADDATLAIDRFGIWRKMNHAGPAE